VSSCLSPGSGWWRSCVPGVVGLLLVGCAAHAPPVGSLLPGARSGARSSATLWSEAASWEQSPASGGEQLASARSRVALAQQPDGGASQQEDRTRARRVEQERAESLMLAARREGREPEAAREAEVDRFLTHVVGVARGVEEVGASLSFTFWVEQGALTLMGYREEGRGGPVGRRVEPEGLERVLRHVFTDYVGRRTGEVVLKLRREEARWVVEHDATRQSLRPPEAKTLPVRTRGIPSGTFLAFHEAARQGLHAVQVQAGGAARVEFVVWLEDGRLVGWELLEVRRTREGAGMNPRPLSPWVAGHVVMSLLPFAEGLGPRSVRVVLGTAHRLGEEEAWGRVESAQVERTPPAPELSWYRAMHEAILLRWREDVHEGAAWLAQKGVEDAALWMAGGIIAKGVGFFATKGLEWVPRALARDPEVAAGWLRTALRRLSGDEKAAFEQLWRKVALEGEQALTRTERETLRSLFVRLEQVIQQPLSNHLKRTLREQAREYYAKLYPQFAEALDKSGSALPIHHRRQLEHAHLFPAEDINAGENLAMLQAYVHKELNLLWGKFRKARPSPTADEVRSAAGIIDGHFEPWYHRVDDPPGLLKTAEEAREASLRELRSRFPGLE
jgi:hypothetical protein